MEPQHQDIDGQLIALLVNDDRQAAQAAITERQLGATAAALARGELDAARPDDIAPRAWRRARASAATCLAELGDPQAVAALQGSLAAYDGDTDDPDARDELTSIFQALDRLGAPVPVDEQERYLRPRADAQAGAAHAEHAHAGHAHAEHVHDEHRSHDHHHHVHDEHCNHDHHHGPAPQRLDRATIKKQRAQSKSKRKQQKASRKRNR